MADYSQMTDEEFETFLDDQIQQAGLRYILDLPGVMEIVREEMNNEVLDAWAGENPMKAWPDNDVVCDHCGEEFCVDTVDAEEEFGEVWVVGNECPECEEGTLRKREG